MFGTIIEVIGAGFTAVLLYQVFLSDAVSNTIETMRGNKKQGKINRDKVSKADKIAKVKLVSNDIKDIEKFIMDNANDLSDATVVKLVSHIEELRAEQDIMGDALKSKIDAITPQPKKKASNA